MKSTSPCICTILLVAANHRPVQSWIQHSDSVLRHLILKDGVSTQHPRLAPRSGASSVESLDDDSITGMLKFPMPSAKSDSRNNITRRHWIQGSILGVAIASSFSKPSSALAADLVTTRSVCDSSVSVWKKDGCIIYLLGTAHISSASAALAGQLIRDTMPKGVFVELDPKRIRGTGIVAQKIGNDAGVDNGTVSAQRTSTVIVPNIQPTPEMSSPTAPELMASASPNSADISRTPVAPATPTQTSRRDGGVGSNIMVKATSALVGKSIKGMYQKLDSAGFDSGEEFVVAVREARKLGADIILGDRDVDVTLRRVAEGLARTDWKDLLNPDSEMEKSIQELVPSSMQSGANGIGGDLTDEEFKSEFSSFVESMKTKENVRRIVGELRRVAPLLYEALVSERDAYMAAGLNGLSNKLETMVAVVGIAHADGIEKNLQANGWTSANPSCSRFR